MELKFRMYNKLRNLMVYSNEAPSLSQFFMGYELGIANKLPIELMQFTGLTDKNGVEIYEGDIVNMVYDEPYDRPHIVVYLEKSAKWIAIHVIEHEAFKSGMREIYFANTGKVPNLFNATVIGNIHSTPELLTPKQ